MCSISTAQKAKVAIEVDGFVHDMGGNPMRDVERDAVLREYGIEVMRIPAADVLKSPDDVADGVVRYCKRSWPLRQSARKGPTATSPFGFAK